MSDSYQSKTGRYSVKRVLCDDAKAKLAKAREIAKQKREDEKAKLLELEKLKFEMESLKMKHAKPLPKIEEEEPTESVSVPETMVEEPDVVPKHSEPINIPNVPQKIRYSTRPQSVWDKYRS